MVYDTKPKLPGDKVLPIINGDELNSGSIRTQQLNQSLQERNFVHERLKSNATKMKVYYDRHLKHLSDQLQVNDWVLIHNENRKKFQPNWTSPYKIKKICPLGTYQLEDVAGHVKMNLVHRDMLKRAYSDSVPKQYWYKSARRNQKQRRQRI